MHRMNMLASGMAMVWLAVLGGLSLSAQDKYAVKVPGGQRSPSSRATKDGRPSPLAERKAVAAILGNPAMIAAYRAGIPG